MPKIITDFIRKADNINILSLVYRDEKYNFADMSDFELFCLFERAVPLMIGTRTLNEYERLLGGHSLDVIKDRELSVSESCARWRRLVEDLFECTFDDEYTPSGERDVCSAAKKTANASEKYRSATVVDVNKFVTENVNISENYGELCERLISKLYMSENIEKSRIILKISFDSCGFTRPDIYTAQRVFEKIKSDEKYNSAEGFVLLSELVIGALLHEKKQKNKRDICLEGRGAEPFLSLLSYLRDRSLFAGDAYLRMSLEEFSPDTPSLFSALLPEIAPTPIVEGVTSEQELLVVICHYPVGALLFDGKSEAAVTEAARGLFSENDGYAKSLCRDLILR